MAFVALEPRIHTIFFFLWIRVTNPSLAGPFDPIGMTGMLGMLQYTEKNLKMLKIYQKIIL